MVPGQPPPQKKGWATDQEEAWLYERMPQYLRRSEKENKAGTHGNGGFIGMLKNEFLVAFPASELHKNLKKARSKIQNWYSYRERLVKQSQIEKPVHVPSIFSQPQRKLVRLQRYQAYSLMYCQKGTTTHTELKTAYRLYTTGDADTLLKYGHLFPGPRKSGLEFVTFQQVVLKDRVSTLTEEELSEVDEWIEDHYQKLKDGEDRPWKVLKVDESQSELDLKQQRVASLPGSLQAICEKVKAETNFKPFIMVGGPNPKGSSGVQVYFVGTGETTLEGHSFDEFLGPQWDLFKNKYGDWLEATYCHDELTRSVNSGDGPPEALPTYECNATSSSPTPASQQPLEPSVTPVNVTETLTTTQVGAPAISTPTIAPEADDNMSTIDSSRGTSPTRTTPDDPSEPAVSLVDDNMSTVDSSRGTSPTRTTPDDSNERAVSPPPSSVTPARPPASRAQMRTPLQSPSWSLGPQHRDYIRSTISYFLGVPGGSKWENLLASFITLESLSSSQPGECKLPTRPRPEEFKWWFQNGRQVSGPRAIPNIEPVRDFEGKWIEWWSAIQPKWRNTKNWPFVQEEDAAGRDWGRLPDGGKNGLFLVMVSLGWWIHAQDPSEGSRLGDAIADVAWVINNLVSLLATKATAHSSSDNHPDSDSEVVHAPASKRKRSEPMKTGHIEPQRKRTKRTNS